MNRLGRRFGEGRGSGTRAGSRACGVGWRLGRAGWLGRSQWDGRLWPMLLKKASEISHLLLQRDELGLQGRKLLWQREQIGGQPSGLAGERGSALVHPGSQAAPVPADLLQRLPLAEPPIAGHARV